MKVLKIPTANYKGLPVEVANEWNKGIKEYLDEFPELRKFLKFVGECNERNMAMKKKYFDYFVPKEMEKIKKKFWTYTGSKTGKVSNLELLVETICVNMCVCVYTFFY